MNEFLRSILASRSVKTEDDIERPLHANIDSKEGEFLQAIIRKYRPRVTLEIGCAYGISSLYICEALRAVGGTKHIIIDPKQHLPHGLSPKTGWEGIGLANLKRAGYADLIEFHEATSFECLPALFAHGEKIDFAFVDGQHTFDYVLVDFFHVDKLLSVGGVAVFDDLDYPSIRKVARYVLTNLPYATLDRSKSRTSITSQIASLPFVRKLVKPELRVPDRSLGIPPGNFMAVQKTAEDLIGEGNGATRRWDTHVSF
jgi:predicted O-methyltransferase YrrM